MEARGFQDFLAREQITLPPKLVFLVTQLVDA